MSEQAVIDFLQATQEDAALLARSNEASDLAAVVSIAQEAGYSFTEEDIEASAITMQKAMKQKSDGELSDDDLEAVAGGGMGLDLRPYASFFKVCQDHRLIFGQFVSAIPVPSP